MLQYLDRLITLATVSWQMWSLNFGIDINSYTPYSTLSADVIWIQMLSFKLWMKLRLKEMEIIITSALQHYRLNQNIQSLTSNCRNRVNGMCTMFVIIELGVLSGFFKGADYVAFFVLTFKLIWWREAHFFCVCPVRLWFELFECTCNSNAGLTVLH